ncbi:hypothetical protein [Kribbella sp. CA-294648]|uniref:hypothetical protein n=1 Tax=Kribbella sp. CA-294648 TaxID=3239948 RepID=UPI003D8E1FA8
MLIEEYVAPNSLAETYIYTLLLRVHMMRRLGIRGREVRWKQLGEHNWIYPPKPPDALRGWHGPQN